MKIIRLIKVKKESTLVELVKQLSQLLNISTDKLRIWPLIKRYNTTMRTLKPIDVFDMGNLTVQEILGQFHNDLETIFVEMASDVSFSNSFDYMTLLTSNVSSNILVSENSSSPSTLPSFSLETDVMLFFKFYDPKTSTLRYVFRMHLPVSANLS